MRRRLLALGLSLATAIGIAAWPAQAEPKAGGTLGAALAAAADEFGVPRDLLVAVVYGESHHDGHDGKPSQDNGFGVMHLVSNPKRQTLEQAASRTGATIEALRTDPATNIRGGAAVLAALADEAKLAGRDRVGAWY